MLMLSLSLSLSLSLFLSHSLSHLLTHSLHSHQPVSCFSLCLSIMSCGTADYIVCLLFQTPGADIFAIGVGHGVFFKELNAMASKPSEQFSFQVSDFRALSRIEERFSQSTCKGKLQQIIDRNQILL